MKALKEKRVSLRSLFRRSLVILSLLALAVAFAFASCGGGSDTGEEIPTEPTRATLPTETTTPSGPPLEKRVDDMMVLSHPRVPSYEGAKVDLTGLEVRVKYSNGTSAIVKGDDLDKMLTTDLPVATVRVPGENVWFSQYTLQYRDDVVTRPGFNSPAFGVRIYVPLVIALMDPDTKVDTDDDGDPDTPVLSTWVYPSITGKVGDVFEDVGIDAANAGGLTITGIYNSWKFGEDWGFTPTNYVNPMTNAVTAFAPKFNGVDVEIPTDYFTTGYVASDPLDKKWEAIYGIKVEDYNKQKTKADRRGYVDGAKWGNNEIRENDAGDEVQKAYYKATNPVSSDPRAWKMSSRGSQNDAPDTLDKENDPSVYDASQAIYLAALNAPRNNWLERYDPVTKKRDILFVDITNFYKVDRIDFDLAANAEQMKKIKPKAADHPDFGGNNVEQYYLSSKAWERRDDLTKVFKPIGTEVKVNWCEELYKAELQFEVTYYLEKDNKAEMKKRTITMYDYVKAMYDVDERGVPRATLPIFSGANQRVLSGGRAGLEAISTDDPDNVDDPSSPQFWAYTDGDFSLYMTLFYYSNLISPGSTVGRGYVESQYLYKEGNGAQIPIATDDVHKVALFAEFKGGTNDTDPTGKYGTRKDASAHEGDPTLMGYTVNPDGPKSGGRGINDRFYASRKDLWLQLQKYWKPVWVYENLDRDNPDEVIQLDIPMWFDWEGEKKADDAFKYQRYAFADYDFDTIEEPEQRSCEINFPAPPSMGPTEDDTLEFTYRVKP